MGNKVSLENELINLRLTSKQQQRGALKCTKNENAAKAKLREAIKAGNIEGARIYGQNAIREKNQSLNCLRLSSRIDAVASRLETAIRMKQVFDCFTRALFIRVRVKTSCVPPRLLRCTSTAVCRRAAGLRKTDVYDRSGRASFGQLRERATWCFDLAYVTSWNGSS